MDDKTLANDLYICSTGECLHLAKVVQLLENSKRAFMPDPQENILF